MHVQVFVDQGGCGTQIFALLIHTVVVYYTQVLQVRIEGTELRKRCGKKEMKKMCHLERGKFSFKLPYRKPYVFFLTSHAAEIACFSSANRELSNAIWVV